MAMMVIGIDCYGRPVVGDLWGDISHAASDVGNFVSHAAGAVSNPGGIFNGILSTAGHVLAPVANLATSIASNAIGTISLIPGIGTGVAAALSAGLAIIEGGSPLDIAIKTAYGAIPIPPGVKQFTDIVLDAVLNLLHAGGNVVVAALATLKNATMNRLPDFARSLAGQVFDTLAHLFVQVTTSKPTHAVTSKPMTPAQVKALAAAFATAGKALPPHVTPVPPTAAHALALHLAPAARAAGTPPPPVTPVMRPVFAAAPAAAPMAPPAAAAAKTAAPRSPGAPPGATFWHCEPLPGGHWQCQWK